MPDKQSPLARTADLADDYGDKAVAAASGVVVSLVLAGALPAEWQGPAILILSGVFFVLAIVRDLATSKRKAEARRE